MSLFPAARGPRSGHRITGIEPRLGNRPTDRHRGRAQAGLRTSVTVPGGNTVTFAYESGSPTSLMNSVQDWSGRTWTLAYDSKRNLTSFETPLGPPTATRVPALFDESHPQTYLPATNVSRRTNVSPSVQSKPFL